MPYRPEHIAHFKSLAEQRPPRVGIVVAWMLAIGIGVSVAVMLLVPWMQTAVGQGQVVSLDPLDRAQDVTTLVPGRIAQWYVQDGQEVAEGDPIDRARPYYDSRVRASVVQVTNLGITIKDSPQNTLVFVTRLDTGAPVPGATVSIVRLDNQVFWTGTTGADGVAIAPETPLREEDEWYKFAFIVTAEKDGDIGYVASNWNEGISPWEFDTSYGLWEATDILRGSVFSDRGVYKPGEEVHVKAIVRLDTPNGMRLMPGGSALDVRVTDTRGKEVDRRRITINKWSSAEWSWTVPESATLGNYWIQVEIPGTTKPEGNDVTERRRGGEWLKRVGGSFLVAAYRKPDFRVDATLTATTPVAGSTLRGAIDARYLFGNAMRGRPVSWSIRREPTFDVTRK